MPKLPRADRSPDIENGVIQFYEGDTFSIAIQIDLEDQFGEPVTLTAEDTVTIEFRDCREEVIWRDTWTGIEDNCITLEIDDDSTRLFRAGKYTYDVVLESETRTTLASGNKIIVRGC